MTNVQPEPVGYQLTAAELRRVADALDTLPPGDHAPYVSLSFLPAGSKASPAEKVAAVDALAVALFGEAGRPEKFGHGEWYHLIRRTRHGVHLTVQEKVDGPPDERDVELDRLRAEVAQLRAEAKAAEPVGEHYETSGWTGGDSDSGVACACGVQFDGFDTLAEAGEQLRRHIADSVGLNYGRGDEAQDPQPTAGRVPPHLEDGRTGEVVECLDCPTCRPPASAE